MTISKKKKNNLLTEFAPGLVVGSIRFTMTTTCYLEIAKYFKTSLKQPGKFGKGIMCYQGEYSDDGNVFLGRNKKLELNILVFLDHSGMQELERFRSDFIDVKTNQKLIEDLTVSGIEAFHFSLKPNDVNTGMDLQREFETSVTIQNKSVPKVSITRNSLYIGGSTGKICLEIIGNVGVDQKVRGIICRINLKDGKTFTQYMYKSPGVNVETLTAFQILSQLSRVNQSVLFSSIQSNLIKEFEVGKVITISQEKTKATTKSGKYVLRSLAGIKNKISSNKTAVEAQTLMQIFFENEKDDSKIEKFKEVLANVLNSLNKTQGKP